MKVLDLSFNQLISFVAVGLPYLEQLFIDNNLIAFSPLIQDAPYLSWIYIHQNLLTTVTKIILRRKQNSSLTIIVDGLDDILLLMILQKAQNLKV